MIYHDLLISIQCETILLNRKSLLKNKYSTVFPMYVFFFKYSARKINLSKRNKYLHAVMKSKRVQYFMIRCIELEEIIYPPKGSSIFLPYTSSRYL